MMCFTPSDEFVPPEPEAIDEDEAEMELQKQLSKQRKLKQKQLLKDSGEKVNMGLSFIVNCMKSHTRAVHRPVEYTCQLKWSQRGIKISLEFFE